MKDIFCPALLILHKKTTKQNMCWVMLKRLSHQIFRFFFSSCETIPLVSQIAKHLLLKRADYESTVFPNDFFRLQRCIHLVVKYCVALYELIQSHFLIFQVCQDHPLCRSGLCRGCEDSTSQGRIEHTVQAK